MSTTRRTALWAAGALALGTSGLGAQTAAAPTFAGRASAERILIDVRYLADDAREGRGVGTAGLDSAAAHIARRFRDAGLAPGGTDGFFQPFVVDSTAPALMHAGIRSAPAKNVIGLLRGKGRLAGQALVVGAHYDHLGRGGFGSMDPDSTGVIHNGADDNASGTAALIEIARLLSGRGADAADRRTIVFIAFTAEELGDIGSSYYVSNPVRPIDSTYAMLNLDMVGRMTENRLMVFGTETAREFPALLDSVNAPHHLTVTGSGDGYGSSDHASFYAAKVPVLFFFTGLHQDYHRTTDDWPKINADGEAMVASLASDVALKLAGRSAPLTYVNVPAPAQTASASGYGAYLGTIPDMTSSPGGVRIQGARAGSPAEAAGLKGGDILVKIGNRQVANLYDMTDALREHQPGDVVDIVVKRGERTDTVTVTLGKRG